jgi:hypothetical protein
MGNSEDLIGGDTRGNESVLITGPQTKEMLHNISSSGRSDRGIIYTRQLHTVPEESKTEKKRNPTTHGSPKYQRWIAMHAKQRTCGVMSRL